MSQSPVIPEERREEFGASEPLVTWIQVHLFGDVK